ncbi:hypothetical protein BKA83DRAFT_4128189 [Pisolithus microcarpus]|nr:hypothetical protein BKA83DRAFT_4128189 [Pisolithus microcarpus]
MVLCHRGWDTCRRLASIPPTIISTRNASRLRPFAAQMKALDEKAEMADQAGKLEIINGHRSKLVLVLRCPPRKVRTLQMSVWTTFASYRGAGVVIRSSKKVSKTLRKNVFVTEQKCSMR